MSKWLYNGVELPGLPEWDTAAYPYAFIYIVTLDGTTGVYTLVVSSSGTMNYDDNGILCPAANVGQRYTVSGEEWAAAADSDDFYIMRDNLIFTVWANFDVLYADGSVYVAASEPVAVAEKFPLRSWVGWLIAGLCSRPVPLGRGEPVAYLYNGVRLPALPEWDVEAYPYVLICEVDGVYYVTTRSDQQRCLTGGKLFWYSNYPTFTLKDGVWIEEYDAFPVGRVIVWANYDVYYSSAVEDLGGTLYMTASDPVPVYE